MPKHAAMTDETREDVLAYTLHPKDHCTQLASINSLERVNNEIKRRSDIVGIFPNERVVVRRAGTLLLEQNGEWAVSGRHMSLHSIFGVSNDP